MLERERALRSETESLLRGVPKIAGAWTVDEVLRALCELLHPLLGFDSCALLVDRGERFTTAAQVGGLEALSFVRDPFLDRILRGRPVVTVDVSAVPAWVGQPPSVRAAVGSALMLPLGAGGRDALLVFGRSALGGFDAAHRRIAERIAPVAGQALLAIEHLELQRAQERAAAETAARDNARLLDRAMGAVDLGLLVVADGRLLLANRTLGELLDGSATGLAIDLPAPETAICPECGRPAPQGRSRFDTGEDGGARRVMEVTFAGHAHRVSTVEGGDLLLVADVTRWVSAEERLQRLNAELVLARDQALAADRAKSQFLATMSHELRTPLTAILGYGDLLRDEAEDRGADWVREDLASVRIAAEQLLQLISDVLDLARLDAGTTAPVFEPIDVSDLVAEVVATARPLADHSGNRLEVSIDGRAIRLRADRRRLRQVLLNLLSNAAKFTEQGTVSLAVRQEADDVIFSVADTGIGIATEDFQRLFQPFVQLDGSTTRRAGGTGLGLAISKRFCESMGGRIEVESRLGVGSTFRVRLAAGG
jgi:signal transduction histidine kinase